MKLKEFWVDSRIRFIVIGALNTCVGFAVFPCLYFLITPFGVGYMSLLIISQFICVNFSFMTNKSFVFKTRGKGFLEYFRYNSFQLIALTLNLVALPTFVEILKINPVISQTIYTTCIVTVSYFWHSNITFSHKNHDKIK